jgi:hypothetical protein
MRDDGTIELKNCLSMGEVLIKSNSSDVAQYPTIILIVLAALRKCRAGYVPDILDAD